MATGFIQLNENDTKELRKEIGLPVTKGVIYWGKEVSGVWKKYNVVDYKIVASYEPSGSKSILITLEKWKSDSHFVGLSGGYAESIFF